MLFEVCAEIKNFFCDEEDRHIDDFTIENGAIVPSFDFPTDYIRIIGSRLNDGVHKVSEMQLKDESFHGGIWIMSPPADFLALVDEIKAWQDKNIDAINSPYQSESFGGYSYSKLSGGNTGDGVSWKNVFASRLKPYRRIRTL